jgi:hypothetical protein
MAHSQPTTKGASSIYDTPISVLFKHLPPFEPAQIVPTPGRKQLMMKQLRLN